MISRQKAEVRKKRKLIMEQVCKISFSGFHTNSSLAVAMEACRHVSTVGRTRRGARLQIRAAWSGGTEKCRPRCGRMKSCACARPTRLSGFASWAFIKKITAREAGREQKGNDINPSFQNKSDYDGFLIYAQVIRINLKFILYK